jgi:hypothetical protein
MFSGIQYPHWLMVAGAVLVVVGFIGFAFHKNHNEPAEKNLKQAAPTDEPNPAGLAREAELACRQTALVGSIRFPLPGLSTYLGRRTSRLRRPLLEPSLTAPFPDLPI